MSGTVERSKATADDFASVAHMDAGMWQAMPPNGTLEFWLDYAAGQRRLARQCAALATTMPRPRASELRRMAQNALYDAHEAEELARALLTAI